MPKLRIKAITHVARGYPCIPRYAVIGRIGTPVVDAGWKRILHDKKGAVHHVNFQPGKKKKERKVKKVVRLKKYSTRNRRILNPASTGNDNHPT
jgi:hypothetical protein